MLTPIELQLYADAILPLYDQLQTDILKDIIRRIKKTDLTVTETAIWQAKILQESGMLYDNIILQIGKTLNKSEQQIKQLFKTAATEGMKFENEIYGQVGLAAKLSPEVIQIIEAGLKKTNNTLRNLTLTAANTSQQLFYNAMDKAHMQVVSGAFDYNTAFFNAAKEVTKEGAYVLYPSGRKDKIDVSARRAVLTGINSTMAEVTLKNMEQLGISLVEVSAHAGARPEHAAWQGGIYSRNKESKYPDFESTTGYGTGAGLCGWNCSHTFYPYIENVSEKNYTKEQVDKLNSETVICDDKEMPVYEATQKMRGMERGIRETKRNLVAMNELKDNPKAQTTFKKLSVKLKSQEATYKNFAEKTGLPAENDRLRTIGFGKSLSQKAVWGNKNNAELKIENILKDGNNNGIVNKNNLTSERIKAANDEAVKKLENFAKKAWGVQKVDLSGLDARAIHKTFIEMDRVYKDFPSLKCSISIIEAIEMKAAGHSEVAIANCKPINKEFSKHRICFNKEFYSDIKNIIKIYNEGLKNHFHPQGTTFAYAGVHELGHVLKNQAIKKRHLFKHKYIEDYNNNETAKVITDKAYKLTKGLAKEGISETEAFAKISRYANVNRSETISEALSEVYANGENANTLSINIIEVLKKFL